MDEYLKTRSAKLIKRIRDKGTPLIHTECEKWYSEAIGDETLGETLKQHLRDAHEGYASLKHLAESFDTEESIRSTPPEQLKRDCQQQENEAFRAARIAAMKAAPGL